MESRDRILNTAVQVFAEMGKHGAVIEEIASQARINKAMVYYYFGGRDGLYREALTHVLTSLLEAMRGNLSRAEMDPSEPAELIESFIRAHYRTVFGNPDWVKLFLGALASDQPLVRQVIEEVNRTQPTGDVRRIVNILDRGTSEGTLREIDTAQLLLSIIGMNLFYIFGKPMAETILNLRVGDEERFLETRLDSIVDLVLHGALPQEGGPPQAATDLKQVTEEPVE